MKKLLIIAALILASAQANAQMILKGGTDLNGEHKVSVEGESGSLDVYSGINVGIEGFKKVNDNTDIGLGVMFQMPREQKVPSYLEDDGAESGKFNFIPIYAALRLHPAPSKFTGYGILQFGYNIFNGDSDYSGDANLSGGPTYGFGGGVIVNNTFIIEALYSVNNGSASLGGFEFDVEYTKLNISLGIVVGNR